MGLVHKLGTLSDMPKMIHALAPWDYSQGGIQRSPAKESHRRFADHLRLAFAVALIALEFTNVFGFVTYLAISNPQTKRFALNFSPYGLQFLGYGICLIVLAVDRESLKQLVKQPIFRWVFVATMVFAWSMLLRAMNPPAGLEDYFFERPFALRINALAFMLSCVLIFAGENVLDFAKLAVAFATLLAIVVNLYEVVYPGTFSVDPGRSAGLYVNPNECGIAIVFGCLTGLTALPRRWREVFLIAAGIGVAATFSREALLAFLIVVVGASIGKSISWPRLAFLIAAAGVLFMTLGVWTSLTDNGVLNADDLDRLTSASDASAKSRYHLAKMVLEKFEEAPLLGNGFETAGYWAHNESHNLYFSFLADHGIFGILLIPGLVLSLFRKTWDYYAFAAAFMLWCFFDHNLFSDSFALIVLAIQANERVVARNPATRGLYVTC
jgi:hypothetical protein